MFELRRRHKSGDGLERFKLGSFSKAKRELKLVDRRRFDRAREARTLPFPVLLLVRRYGLIPVTKPHVPKRKISTNTSRKPLTASAH